MKQFNCIILILVMILTASCVQKSYKQTVTLFLDVSDVKNVKTVGVKGSDAPLSWENDTEMQVVKKDSLYKITLTGETGRLCSELKFTVNGNFELENKENRKVYFDKSKTTVYNAKFDIENGK
jgi:hypothetical protein